MKKPYWAKWNANLNRFVQGRFSKYHFGQRITVSKGGRNWNGIVKEAQLDRDMNFVNWKVLIINWRLWYKMFPSERCTHYISVSDPNFSGKNS